MRRATATLLLLLLFSVSALSQVPDDYLIVPAQRLGRYELGKPVDAYDFGPPAGRWQGRTSDGRVYYYDGYSFLIKSTGLSLQVFTCRSDGLAFAITAVRQVIYSNERMEATKFKTAEGIGIESDEAEVLRILGPPENTSRWIERHGSIEVPVLNYHYSGLRLLLSATDRRVFSIGPVSRGGWNECLRTVQASPSVTQPSSVAPPPELTAGLPCVSSAEVTSLLNETKPFEFVPASFLDLLKATGACIRKAESLFPRLTVTYGATTARAVFVGKHWYRLLNEKVSYWASNPEVKLASVDLALPKTSELPGYAGIPKQFLPLPDVTLLDILLFRPALPMDGQSVVYGLHFKGGQSDKLEQNDFWIYFNWHPNQNSVYRPTWMVPVGRASRARAFLRPYLPILDEFHKFRYLETVFARGSTP